MSATAVLKFGSSVLQSADHLPLAVHEIYRALRQGRRVVAVVSALGRTTDALLARARSFGSPDPRAVASLLSIGETESAALLSLALGQAGLRSSNLDAAQAGLRSRGPLLDADPVAVDAGRIHRELDRSGIVVVPGFVAQDRSGAPALLGRGGSDLTALFLAHALGAGCVLYKDVDGLYDRDPRHHPGALRYGVASWATAKAVAGKVVQERALLFAESRGVRFAIAAPGSRGATLVGPGPDVREQAPVRRKLRVALFGHGTVGSGLYRRLRELPEQFEVVGIAVRDPRKAEAAGAPAALLEKSLLRVLQRPAEVAVELIGGVGRATRLIALSLGLGRHVVTANKALIATHGLRLEELARSRGVSLLYSASVGGALPALETLRRSAGEVRSFSGILNATSNYVLDSIASGLAPDEAVRAAQREGYAEADPTLDLDGTDAAQKLVILARAAFGREVRVEKRGIEALDPARVREARAEGLAVRLVASCGEGLRAEVAPVALPFAHPLGETAGAENRLVVERHGGPPIFLSATGAGRWPTAEAVLADLFDVQAEVRP